MDEPQAESKAKRALRALYRRARDMILSPTIIGDIRHVVHAISHKQDVIRQDLYRAEHARLAIQDQISVGANRTEHALEEVRALRHETLQRQQDVMDQIERLAPAVKMPVLHEARIDQIDDRTAGFLNYAHCHVGPLRDAGVWLNDAVVIEWLPGGARIGAVNERIVEQPFVFAACAALPAGSRILDIGGGESTVGFSLASLGYDVTVVEPAGYQFEHPNLTVVEERLEDIGPDAPFDAVILLSAIEHFGLAAYTNSGEANDDADFEALAWVAANLAPGGTLVLTTPFGPADVNELERTYDEARLTKLLDGFAIERAVVASRLDDITWKVTQEGLATPPAAGHVAMVVATRP